MSSNNSARAYLRYLYIHTDFYFNFIKFIRLLYQIFFNIQKILSISVDWIFYFVNNYKKREILVTVIILQMLSVQYHWHHRLPRRAWRRASRRRNSRRGETDRRRRSCVFPASNRFPATTWPPAGSEETDVSPGCGGQSADISWQETSIETQLRASSSIAMKLERRRRWSYETRTHATRSSRRRQTHNDAFLATRHANAD